jgi:hypothetical protein
VANVSQPLKGKLTNEDYQVYNVVHPVANVSQSVKQGGYSIKKEYKLTPYAFKLCL